MHGLYCLFSLDKSLASRWKSLRSQKKHERELFRRVQKSPSYKEYCDFHNAEMIERAKESEEKELKKDIRISLFFACIALSLTSARFRFDNYALSLVLISPSLLPILFGHVAVSDRCNVFKNLSSRYKIYGISSMTIGIATTALWVIKFITNY
jgi:hypothetical protein